MSFLAVPEERLQSICPIGGKVIVKEPWFLTDAGDSA